MRGLQELTSLNDIWAERELAALRSAAERLARVDESGRVDVGGAAKTTVTARRLDVDKLKRAKAAKRMEYEAAAAVLVREAGVEEWRQDRKNLSGYAHYKTKVIDTPPPTTLRRFCVVAHECEHIAARHNHSKRRYEEEYEACRAEERACRRFRFRFPRKELRRNKRYVATKLLQGLRRGLDPDNVDRKILRWCWDYVPGRWRTLLSR